MKILNDKIPKLLRSLCDGQYHDGTALGKKLNITRSAVWKIVKKLQDYDVKIDSIKGKGYALKEPLSLLSKNDIIKSCAKADYELDLLETVDSTNNYLQNLTHQNKKYHFCLAEHQQAGKGRLNRQWHAPFGKNIYMSYKFLLNKDMSELSGISLAVGLAIINTITPYNLTGDVRIKWPNDVYCDHKKIAGILIEASAESNGYTTIIIGIGINVNMTLDASTTLIKADWTSMMAQSKYINRNELSAQLIEQMIACMDKFAQTGFDSFSNDWDTYDYLKGKDIRLIQGKNKIAGTMLGIDNHGHLQLKMSDGETRSFSSGDISIDKTSLT